MGIGTDVRMGMQQSHGPSTDAASEGLPGTTAAGSAAERRMASYRKFSLEVFFVAAGQLLPRLKGLVMFPIVTKALGASEYGVFAQVWVTVGLVSPFALLGVNTGMRRFLPGLGDRHRQRGELAAGLLLILANSLILTGALYGFAPFLVDHFFGQADAVSLLRLASVLIPISILNQVLLECFVTFGRAKFLTILGLGRDVLEVALAIVYLLGGGGLFGLLLITIGATLVSSVVALAMLARKVGLAKPLLRNLGPYLRVGFPLFVSGFGYWAIHSGGRYVIGYFMDARALGVYSGTFNLSMIIMAIAGPVYFVLLPTVSGLWESNRMDDVRAYFHNSVKLFLSLGIPAAVGMSMLGGQVLEALSTAEFVEGAVLVPLLAGSIVVYQSLGIAEYILTLARRTSYLPPITFGGALINLLMAITLVPTLGLLGAALANAAGYLFLAVVTWTVSRRFLKFKIEGMFLGKCLVASGTMAAVVWLAMHRASASVSASVVLGAAVYGAVLLGLRGWRLDQLRALLGRS